MSDIKRLKGKLGGIRDWMTSHRIPPRILFIFLGVISTVWFLVRVIPKPSRASYPCMRAAAPFMSGFVMYLLSVWGLVVVSRTSKFRMLNTRYLSTLMLVFAVLVVMAVNPSSERYTSGDEAAVRTGTEDGPNQPFGKGVGIYPGRVVWIWDPAATNENAVNAFYLHTPENTDQKVASRMFADGIKQLTGKKNLKKSWDVLFRDFNKRKKGEEKGYSQGEKIFIKINQGTANGKLRPDDIKNGFYIPQKMTDSERAKQGLEGTCETYPNLVLELLRELVNEAGVEQKDISIGDPISHIFGHNYDIWHSEFPDVVYCDRASENSGRTLIKLTEKELLNYSDRLKKDKLYDVIEAADYMINVANLKPHGRAGISLTAKNHFGSQGSRSAFHLHYSLISPVSLGKPTNNGYRKYRVFVDIMGSRYLGQNTLLFVVDGLFGGGSNEAGHRSCRTGRSGGLHPLKARLWHGEKRAARCRAVGIELGLHGRTDDRPVDHRPVAEAEEAERRGSLAGRVRCRRAPGGRQRSAGSDCQLRRALRHRPRAREALRPRSPPARLR